MTAIWRDKIQIAKAVNATVISLDEAPKGYGDFDKGAAKKFVIDPNGLVKKLPLNSHPGSARPANSPKESKRFNMYHCVFY